MVSNLVEALAFENVWVEKSRYSNAERVFYELLNKDIGKINKENLNINLSASKIKNITYKHSDSKIKKDINVYNSENYKHTAKNKKSIIYRNICHASQIVSPQENSFNSQSTLVSEIAKAREHIKNSLEKMDGITSFATPQVSSEILDRVTALEKNNNDLKQLVNSLNSMFIDSQKRILELEKKLNIEKNEQPLDSKKELEDDDGVDLFASDSDDDNAEAIRIREERLAAYAAKKSKKPVLIAKSSLVLDVKPWDDETDLNKMEEEIRKIKSDGLLWGASKFAPVAFGINKLTISCVVEDEKVSIDWLTEEIEKLEDFVQSVDVAAFNKI